MNSFFKTFWAALLAFAVAIMAFNLLAIMFFAGLVAAVGSPGRQKVMDNSVLKIDLEGAITDAPPTSPVENFDFQSLKSRPSNTLLEALGALESAAIDDRIRGIYINITGGGTNAATTEELRQAIVRFRESGKFVVAYNEYYTPGRYWLASAADSVWLNPLGEVSWKGMSASLVFYKGLIDKLGVQVQVLRHGSFKSAVEPYIMDGMSPENRMQYERLTGSVWGTIVSQVAASRGIDSLELQRYASELSSALPGDALRLGFVDGLKYDDQVRGSINSLLGEEPDAEINTISLPDYIAATAAQRVHVSDNLIRVIYAEGGIVDGKSARGEAGGATVAEQLAEARADEDVKAVVLRVNSPGGMVVPSEVIRREVELLKAGKPVVVSMGGMAASGGYWISCGADAILSNRTTLTGSIGVFGLYPSWGNALKDKLGVTVDVVRTNPSADMGSGIVLPFRPLSEREYDHGMKGIEHIYTTFVNHVAAGRNMTFEQVDAIAQGRVWSGADALEIGLVDGLGGLKDAVALAADRAGVAANFSIDTPVGESNPLSMLLTAFASARAPRLEGELGRAVEQYRALENIVSRPGVHARLPHIVETNLN